MFYFEMSQIEPGFLTLSELIEIQKKENIFSSDEEDMYQVLMDKLAKGNTVTVDLRLGREVFLSCDEIPRRLDHNSPYLVIKPGEFALLSTYEELNMPTSLFAFISMRFKYKQKGLINVSGFHIDPGYQGRIVYSVYNAGPNRIVLKYGEEVFTLIFAKLHTPADERKNSNFQGLTGLEPGMISGLTGEPISLRSLHDRIQKLELQIKVIVGVIPIAIAITGLILSIFKPFG